MGNISTESIFSSLEHDLKSPLVGILSVCALVKFLPGEKIAKKTLEDTISKIEQKAHASINLIEDISFFSRLSTQTPRKNETINLAQIIKDVQKKHKKDLRVVMLSTVSIKGKKIFVSKIIEFVIQEAMLNSFRDGVVTLEVIDKKNVSLNLSYNVIRETNGISQDIDSGKEKLYYYLTLALLKACHGKMQIHGGSEKIEVLVTL